MLYFIAPGRGGAAEVLACAGCGAAVARAADVCRVLGRPPRREYVNPQGVRCPLLTLADAQELVGDDWSTTQDTWFDGYAWRPVHCAACSLFLGWRFEATGAEQPPSFYGLLEERLQPRTLN